MGRYVSFRFLPSSAVSESLCRFRSLSHLRGVCLCVRRRADYAKLRSSNIGCRESRSGLAVGPPLLFAVEFVDGLVKRHARHAKELGDGLLFESQLLKIERPLSAVNALPFPVSLRDPHCTYVRFGHCIG